MRGLPLSYSVRNLWTRKLTTILTAGGMALVVFVFAAVLMLDAGLKAALVATGQYDNVVVTRRSAVSEVQSSVDRNQARIIESQPELATGSRGARMVSKEAVLLIGLNKRGASVPLNVPVRGIGAEGLSLRPQVAIVSGRMFQRGGTEVVVGRSIAERFEHAELGQTLRFGARDWTVVGVFDAGGAAFDSEIWTDGEQLMQSFRRQSFSAVIARLSDPNAFEALKARLESDPRLTVEVRRERRFYEEQSELLSNFIKVLGLTLSIVFSIGAMIGAMITMYAAVANRVREIGALRALGFRRSNILAAFLLEALALTLIGWGVGLALAAPMQFVQISTLNWQSFSELAFRFTLTPGIMAISLAFAVAMGLMGGFLPAVKAARVEIVHALRTA
jgi:ABC-type antimicrobial peptide transport system permease subunit